MAQTFTPEQVRDQYIAAMPAPLGGIYYELYNHTAWLYSKWHDYLALFDTRETVDLLNLIAGPPRS
jgi:hypothetical protein